MEYLARDVKFENRWANTGLATSNYGFTHSWTGYYLNIFITKSSLPFIHYIIKEENLITNFTIHLKIMEPSDTLSELHLNICLSGISSEYFAFYLKKKKKARPSCLFLPPVSSGCDARKCSSHCLLDWEAASIRTKANMLTMPQ